MSTQKHLKYVISVILIFTFIILLLPAESASAKSKSNKKDFYCEYDKDDKWKSHAKDYLVLVGQKNGTYIAYDNIAFVTAKDKVMVKAKPLASALGLSYRNNPGGHGRKKGCVLALGNKKNVYTKNYRTFYYYNNSKKIKKFAEYKQSVYKNYNSVHCATLSTLVNFKYFDTYYVDDYEDLGYRGVVVYDQYNRIYRLPDLSNVTNLRDLDDDNDDDDDQDDDDDDKDDDNDTPVNNVTLTTSIFSNNSYYDAIFVEATYSIASSSKKTLLDLSEVLNTFKAYGLPYNGVYGYGNCETDVTIQGIDKNGYSIGEIKTSGSEFLINFPGAVKLSITGDKRNLMIDFTPVKPFVITSATKLAFHQIGWLYPSDGYARQYFVLADYMKFSLENVTFPHTYSRKMLELGNSDTPDYSSSYQRVTAVFKGTREEMSSYYRYIDVTKTNHLIDNSLVVFQANGNTVLPSNYETELNTMIVHLINSGLNQYYPSKNFDSKLIMKLPDGVTNRDYSYITVDQSILDLNHFLDYYNHLHEMAHFYEAQQLHYGFQFPTWSEGNAITLSKKTLNALDKSYTDTNGADYFDSLYATNFSFLTEYHKNNFEAYYLNASGWNASVIGYHFTNFLQTYYGSDVIYEILQKVYAANIPTNTSRNSAYDKLFTDCIKDATSSNIFQLFVDTCVN